jgi:outer membrane protein OmpA-like peptidoglycan-associated protein/uncharacterized protein YidB (DUF937 family)
MFEQIVNEAASRFNLPAASVTSLLRGLLSLITNERTGGAEGFVDLFRRVGLGDVITSWVGGKEGQEITTSHLESALGTSTLDTLAGSSGLTRGAVTSALTFLLPKVIGRLTPGGAFPSRPALLSRIADDMAPPAAMAVGHGYGKRGWSRWLPWAAAAVLALVGFLWLRGSPGTIDPQLALSNRDGKVSYSGLVRDETTRKAIVDTLRKTFGESNVEGNLQIDRDVKPARWLPGLDALASSLKVPGLELTLDGNDVELGGWLSADDRQTVTAKLHGIFGADADIGWRGDVAGDAVRAANEKAFSALDALDAIDASNVSGDTLVEAMNLAIINFAPGSAEIPPESMEVLRRFAAAIKRAPADSHIEIGGHTDNTGEAAGNLALSLARADSVRNVLVSEGVRAAMLTARGYGDTRPRAANDTEFGRFNNRRIVYRVVH